MRGPAKAISSPRRYSAWPTCFIWPGRYTCCRSMDRVISSASEITLVMLTIALLIAFPGAPPGLRCGACPRVDACQHPASIRRSPSRVMTAIIDRSASFWRRAPARCCAISIPSASSSRARASMRSSICPGRRFYIAVIFALHPALGAFALGCSILLVLMALLKRVDRPRPPLTEIRRSGLTQLQAYYRNEPAQQPRWCAQWA